MSNPIKFPYPAQAVKLANKFPARRFKPVRWGAGWALAKPNGKLVTLDDLK